MNAEPVQNLVLVHGGFVDGSGWCEVYRLLTDDGFRVRHPTLSLADDVAAVERVLDALDGPAILVGHSYGGAVITVAGHHDRVAALVYVAAFVPDKGDSVGTLIADPSPGAPVPPILPPVDGFLFLDRDEFHEAFAADVPLAEAESMADARVPWGLDALGGTVGEPAWRHRPSWYLVAADDQLIPPPAQRAMARRAGSAATGTDAGHAVYVPRPDAVADPVRQAATGAT
ncbi:alpha/beta fold hydrolase [Streptomyces sp. NPDC058420]|uniref:alpha/beta fold hydrolase n=1 Tax=Streptomyces sp. NPDC058420 TaxID=3346489 RepID=UPI00364FDAC4